MRKRKSGGLSAGIVVPGGHPPAGTTAGLALIRLRRAGEIAGPGGTVIDAFSDQPSRSIGTPRSSCWEKRAAKMAARIVSARCCAPGDDVSCTIRESTVGSWPDQKSSATPDAKWTSPDRTTQRG